MDDVSFCDGHDNAFVGFMWRFGYNKPIATYSQRKIVENLMADGMMFDDAQEFFEFYHNRIDCGLGTPCFLEEITLEEAKERIEDYQ